MQLEEGQRIRAPFLSGVAEVVRFAPKRGYYLLKVVLQDGRHTYQPLRITGDQLATVQVLSQERPAPAGNAEDFFFAVEATRIRLAYQFDPHLAISVSQVDPLPHQKTPTRSANNARAFLPRMSRICREKGGVRYMSCRKRTNKRTLSVFSSVSVRTRIPVVPCRAG
jgi:hypothetical protein